MSEGSDDEFPYGGPSLESSTHPAHDDPGDGLTMADQIRLLGEGDRVLWMGRKEPLKVVERATEKENRYENGRREIAWRVRGPQGASYLLDNWWHWGDGDGMEDTTGCYPQVHRTTDGRWQDGEHFDALAIDGPVALGPGWEDGWDLEDMEVLVYEEQTTGERHAGRVVRTEFGQPVVEPLDLQPLVDAEHTVDASDVIAYRWSQ